MHYSRWKTHGTPNGPGRRAQSDSCSVAGCETPPIAKDLCKKHYYAERRRVMKASRTPPKEVVPTLCAVPRCEGRATARGWCGKHYQRWRRFGDPEFFPPPPDKRCTVEGCDGTTNARGLCDSHYYRWWRYGDPEHVKNKPRVTNMGVRPARPCATCGLLFEPGRSNVRKYCSRKCRPTRASVGVNKRATVERLGKDRGWVCRLCGGEIDSTLYWPNPLAGSVDHVIPASLGGSDDWDNLQLAHLTCNVSRGPRPLPDVWTGQPF